MPKIIKDARETIMQKAKEILLRDGLVGLNMRGVAQASGVAAGTLYNYFPSKEDLVFNSLKKNWDEMLDRLEKKTPMALTACEGLKIIFDMLREYSSDYSVLFNQMRATKSYDEFAKHRHSGVVEDISEQIHPLGIRFHFMFDPSVSAFLAEVLVTSSFYQQGQFSFLEPCLKKITGEIA